MIKTSQKEMLNFDPDDILCMPLYRFLPPTEAVSTMAAILAVFETGLPLWHAYSYRSSAFLHLICPVDDDVVVIHEVSDNFEHRPELKKFLSAAAKNFDRLYSGRPKTPILELPGINQNVKLLTALPVSGIVLNTVSKD